MIKYCPNCGTEFKNGASFCSECGYSMNNASQNTNTNTYANGNNAAQSANVYSPKSKIAAGLLGIFLGCFGVHNFYLGYNGKAIAQLLMTVLSCGILGIVSGIWGLIEGILILTGSMNTDAEGNFLVD